MPAPKKGTVFMEKRETNTHCLTLWLRQTAGKGSWARKTSEEQLEKAFQQGGLTSNLCKVFLLPRPIQTRPREPRLALLCWEDMESRHGLPWASPASDPLQVPLYTLPPFSKAWVRGMRSWRAHPED